MLSFLRRDILTPPSTNLSHTRLSHPRPNCDRFSYIVRIPSLCVMACRMILPASTTPSRGVHPSQIRVASLLLLLASGNFARAEENALTAEQSQFFESKIRPVLVQKCYDCHSAQAKKVKGGLKLDTRDNLLRGGDTGPAVTPGKPEESLLVEALRYTNKDMQMPPKAQLSDSVVHDFETWIRMGAPDPRTSGTGAVADADKAKAQWKKREIDINEGRKFWAYQAPASHTPPQVKNNAWPKNDIDRFVLAKMEEKHLEPVGDAPKLALLRRLCFDLTGLPPEPELIERFTRDTKAGAYERVVDELLASDRFGENWGRHWLDVARYAESAGKDVNIPYPFAWRYRDWVIEALNKNMPYDEFLREQVAGDLLPYKDVEDQCKKIVATGFLAVGTKPQNERNPRQFQLELVDEQIDSLTQCMLASTVACARCHDHKFDPIRQKDYYALAGIFLSSEALYGTNQAIQNAHPSDLIDLGVESHLPAGYAAISAAERKRLVAEKADLQEQVSADQREAMQARVSGNKAGAAAIQRVQFERTKVGDIDYQLNRYDEKGQPRILAMGVYDRRYPTDSPIYSRGDATQPQETVPRGLVAVMLKNSPAPINKGSGRLELAQWLGSKDNPLTARVYVNRVWRWLMGHGIVASVDNFGAMGERPTNPELLDQLAVEFMADDWNVKSLIRRIVLSHTYQAATRHDAQNFAIDPENTLFWRANEKRLSAEEMRDALLAVSGKLDLYPKDGSPVLGNAGNLQRFLRSLPSMEREASYYRSVYLPIVRDQLPEALSLFDFADPSLVTGDRDNTNVPSQGLYLLNSPQVQSLADGFADQVCAFSQDTTGRVARAYWVAFGRAPSTSEQKSAAEFIARCQNLPSTRGAARPTNAWSTFCQALMGSAEFRYLN